MGNPVTQVLRLIGRAVATVVVVIWLAFEVLLLPLVRPVVRWLSSLAFFEKLGALIGRLPPYAVLAVLAVPFVLVEPLKAIGLYWMATGLVVRGLALFVFAHLVSLLTLDRIYHAGRSQLMKIDWFAGLMGWLVRLKDRAFGWVRSTPAWRWAAGVGAGVRAWARKLIEPATGP
jgi:hypothetical protein